MHRVPRWLVVLDGLAVSQAVQPGYGAARLVRRPSVLPSPAAGAIPHAAAAADPSERLSKPELSKHASTVGHWFGWHDDSERTKDRPGRWSRRDRPSQGQGAAGAQAGSVPPAEQEGEQEQEPSAMLDAQRLTRAALEAAATARQGQSGGAMGAVQSVGGGETLTELEA